MRPDTSGAPHNNSSKQSSTANQKWPFYMTMLWTNHQYTGSHSPHHCDMLSSHTNHRAASLVVMSRKRQDILST